MSILYNKFGNNKSYTHKSARIYIHTHGEGGEICTELDSQGVMNFSSVY